MSRSEQSEPADASSAPTPDQTWGYVVSSRDPAFRQLTRVIPYRIGISPRPDGNFSDYVREPLMFDLPALVAVETDIPTDELQRWTRAHHCAGFYGLVTDRIADGQVVPDAALRADQAWMFECWVSHFAIACGDLDEARSRIERERAQWTAAVERERSWSRGVRISIEDYGRVVRAKCAFLWVTAEAMLEHGGVPLHRVAQIREAFERVMIALQCCDDARDGDEDREMRGASTAELLGVDEHSLNAAAALLLQRTTALDPPRSIARYVERSASVALAAIPIELRIPAALGAMLIVPGLEQP